MDSIFTFFVVACVLAVVSWFYSAWWLWKNND